ncbi:hypothetical protein MPTK2_8g13970 [Marchantia polymorpha subsp. ruderalis]
MDSKLWSRLPEDEQVMVLSFLPWFEILRLRVVCVKWNQILRSSEFRQNWRGRESSQTPLCFMGSKDYGTRIYNPALQKWQDCGRSFVTFRMDEGVYKAPDARVMGSARGLLLLQILLGPGYAAATPHSLMQDLFVVNPLDPLNKKRVRLLPHLQHPNTSSVLGMAWNDITRSHQILFQHHPEGLIFNDISSQESNMWTFYSYDVENDAWDRVARWPKDRYRDFQSPSIAGGNFQCLAKMCSSSLPYGSTPPSVQRFRYYLRDKSGKNWLNEPTWVELEDHGAPSLPYPLHFAILFHQDHETFVAGGEVSFSLVDNSDEYIGLQDFTVWKLHEERSEESECEENQWLEIHRMPSEIVDTFRKGVNMQFYCAANEKFLIVANWWRDCAVLDMNNMSWRVLPPEPHNLSAESPIREELFDLFYLHLCEPRLDILL